MKRGSKTRSALVTLLMLSPGLAGFFGLFFYPMLVTVERSLRPEGQSAGWTVEHYVKFLTEPRARDVIVLTFELSIAATLCSILLSVILSLVLRRKPRGNRFFRLTMLIPRVVPGLIGALGLLLLFGSRGWLNLSLIKFIPFIDEPIGINYTVPGLIVFYTWLYFPFTAVTTFMSAFGAFSIPLIAGGNYRPLSVEIYSQINFTPARWSAASARAMIMAALQVAFLTFYMRVLRRPSA